MAWPRRTSASCSATGVHQDGHSGERGRAFDGGLSLTS